MPENQNQNRNQSETQPTRPRLSMRPLVFQQPPAQRGARAAVGWVLVSLAGAATLFVALAVLILFHAGPPPTP